MKFLIFTAKKKKKKKNLCILHGQFFVMMTDKCEEHQNSTLRKHVRLHKADFDCIFTVITLVRHKIIHILVSVSVIIASSGQF